METHFYFFQCTETVFWKHVVKHTLKLKNIGVYYYLQKTPMSVIKM